MEEKTLLAECVAVGRQYVLQKRLRNPECVSRELFTNALALARNRGLLRSGTEDLADRRRRFAEETEAAVAGVAAIGALDYRLRHGTQDLTLMHAADAVAAIEAGPKGPDIGAFFDFDGTLIDGYSAVAYFADRLRRREMGLGEAADIVRMARRGDVDEANSPASSARASPNGPVIRKKRSPSSGRACSRKGSRGCSFPRPGAS